jgi:hypothetical protein
MTPSAKRLPGQDNAGHEGRKDPNSDFIGTQSLDGGSDPSFVYRGLRALLSWLDRRRGRRSR